MHGRLAGVALCLLGGAPAVTTPVVSHDLFLMLGVAFALAASGCNTKTMANDRRCRALSAEQCRSDSSCIAVGGKGLEPYPPSIAKGERCEPGCAKGWMPEECTWGPRRDDTPADRVAKDGRACLGPARCQLNRTNTGDYCFDPNPPCGGCRQVFDHCQSVNLCSGVICP